MRDDNGYQLGLALTQLSRIADALERVANELTTINGVSHKLDGRDDGQNEG